ncbi:MAG: lysostaphin resistance A-like protein [Christensenellales bacterium]
MKKRSPLLLSTLITYFVLLVMFILVRLLFLYVNIESDIAIAFFDLGMNILVQVGVMFLLPVFLFSTLRKQKPTQTLREFGYNSISAKSILLCVLIGFVCYFLNLFVASFFSSIIHLCGYEEVPQFAYSSSGDYSLGAFFLQVILVAVLPAICEETTHRGLLLRGMSSMGIMKAVVLSSIFFGLMHMNILQFFYATVLGFIIALSVVISKSILPGIIIHFMNNFMSVYFTFAQANNWVGSGINQFLDGLLFGGSSVLGHLVSVVLSLTVVLGLLILLFVALLKETRVKKVQKMLCEIQAINKEISTYPQNFGGNTNLLNLHFLNKLMNEYNIKGLETMIFTDLEQKPIKSTPFEKVCMLSCFVLGILVTISTFVWGIL